MWDLAPVGLLRYAGFPFDLLRPLADEAAAEQAQALLGRTRAVAGLAQRVKAAFREYGIGKDGDLASDLGMLRAVPEENCVLIRLQLDGAGREALDAYNRGVTELDGAWSDFTKEHAARLEAGRRYVVDAFDDPALRQVLLLSNDAGYREFTDWLDHGGAGSAGHRRRMTDLLTMYLQRVTTKNETNSHFGPLSTVRVTARPGGLAWSEGGLERRAFFAHWAGEALAEVFSGRPGLRDLVRPRRRPLAFLEGAELRRYAFRTSSGTAGDWRFLPEGAAEPTSEERWVWERCEARLSRAELRGAWRERYPQAAAGEFDRVLDGLDRDGWVVARWEIPIGAPDPLGVLARLLDEAGPAGAVERALVERLKRALGRFASASPDRRAAALEEIKAEFSAVTEQSANRAGGRHYADRTVVFEEAFGPVRNMTIGADVAATLGAELAPAYDLALLPSRRRLRREGELLRDWVVSSFGADTPVPLERFYARFFEHKPALDRACEEVDRDVLRLEAEIAGALLGEDDGGEQEVVLEAGLLEKLIAREPDPLPAVCNPDVLLAARDREALGRGDYLAVVGECHAVRELLTHSSFAPMLQSDAPELLEEIHRRYRALLAEDELLVDVVRSHRDKTGTALSHPCPDFEVHGLSSKPRDRVLHPAQCHVVVRGGRLELRAEGVAQRLRLMAPLAGGPSIRRDPLVPFSFPRHFGGLGLRGPGRAHLPRIRYGRVVLQRELWRIPSGALRGWSPGVHRAAGDAPEFAAACRLRAELGLPRHGFAKIPGEPKPVFVDWTSPLLVRQLFRLARKAEGAVEFTEMLPAPDQLWLDVDGGRRTSELRCAVFSRGPGAEARERS
ncbi:lantibiotic dehydratase family protein (plasmid) [Streptomyces viridifaciens]|nr:lantibiotic dehydratase family protein [Streptomyces viridifaciens]